jgi:hypothetical protein
MISDTSRDVKQTDRLSVFTVFTDNVPIDTMSAGIRSAGLTSCADIVRMTVLGVCTPRDELDFLFM